MTASPSHITASRLTKQYKSLSSRAALDDVSLTIPAGQFVAVVGKSGSGKSTFFNLIAGLDRPSSGTVRIGETDVSGLTEGALGQWRGRNVGLVFQFFQLLPTLTALENVIAPMEFTRLVPMRQRRDKARGLLDALGLGEHADHRPAQLSGGQQQRVAIARALACDPAILLADEPTGNLDSASAAIVLETLRAQTVSGRTVIMITHDAQSAGLANRIVRLADGRIVDDTLQGAAL
ncbi:MAG: ABC transporter ATP-binding protein [Hyphomicrobiaceae bacterium]|nr:ABC transporter ATP-binding protein [Hyphomicrobiaceae bacterium]